MRVGFLGLLTLIFITLKLTEVVTWSWIWVLSPLWIPISILSTVLMVIGIFLGIRSAIKK